MTPLPADDDRVALPYRSEPIEPPEWPGGAAGAVSLTFDVDAEAGLLGRAPQATNRLSSLSAQRYGVDRGLERVLATLREHEAPATFYVPGATALAHPHAIAAILDAGHEVAHHGHRHVPSHLVDAAEQREEVVAGLDALERIAGRRPAGYRSPAWELTPETLALLIEHDFDYDSSLMEDDRPHRLVTSGGSLVELPVDWVLDDVPHLLIDADRPVPPAADEQLSHRWTRELRAAVAERRHVTFTMHPSVIGRPVHVGILDALLRAADELGAWVSTHAATVAHLTGKDGGHDR